MRKLSSLVACVAVLVAGCSRRAEPDCVVVPPDETPGPVLRIHAAYPGANAKVVADTVAAPIEHQVNGTEGLLRIESECRGDGSYVATLRFAPKTDAHAATVLVQNRLAVAEPTLPEEVRRQGVTVHLGDRERFPRFWVALTAVDPGTKAIVIAKLVEQVRNALTRVPGVADVRVFGPSGWALRVWLNPDRLAARALTVQDVVMALSAPDSRVAVGRTVRVAPEVSGFEVPPLVVSGEQDAAKLEQTVVKQIGGRDVFLRDVANVEYGVQSDSLTRFGDRPAALIAVAGADGQALEAAAKAAKQELVRFEGTLAGEVLPDVATGEWSLIEVRFAAGTSRAQMEKHANDLVKWIRATPDKPACFAYQDGEPNVIRVVAKLAPGDARAVGRAMAGFATVPVRVSDLAAGEPFPVRIALTDEGGHAIEKLREWADAVARRLEKDGDATSPLVEPGPDVPDISVVIDREKAAALGVTARDIAETLHAAFGDLNTFNGFGTIDLSVDLAALDAKDPRPENLKKLQVKTRDGERVALGSVVKFLTAKSPPAFLRVNLHPAVRITAAAPDGRPVAEAAAKCVEIAEVVRKEMKLPDAFKAVNLTESKPR